MKPIAEKAKKYEADPNSRNIFMAEGVLELVEPVLLVTNVEWQQGSAFYQQKPITHAEIAALPEIKSALGDKVTICLLLCGPHDNIQREGLKTLARTVDLSKIDLRIAKINVSQAISTLITTLSPTKVYEYSKPVGKFKVMRDLFWDPAHKIATDYVVWFDDNAFIRNPKWLKALADTVKKQTARVGMYGPRMIYKPDEREFKSFESWADKASWCCGQHWQTQSGGTAPNGDCVHYCASWFFLIKTEAVVNCNIPDPRLVHRLGDIAIGAQLHQNGYYVKDFNSAKNVVYTPPSNSGVQREKPTHTPW